MLSLEYFFSTTAGTALFQENETLFGEMKQENRD
jgi:hypothetical protein